MPIDPNSRTVILDNSNPEKIIVANEGEYFFRDGRVFYIIRGTSYRRTEVSLRSFALSRSNEAWYATITDRDIDFVQPRELWLKGSGNNNSLNWRLISYQSTTVESVPEPSLSASPTPSITVTPTVTPGLTATQSPTPTQTLTPTVTPTFTVTPTNTPTTTPTPTQTPTPAPNDIYDEFESYPTGSISTLTGGTDWYGDGNFSVYFYIENYDEFESYSAGSISTLTDGTGWGGSGNFTTYSYTTNYDEFESYSTGSISTLTQGTNWGGDGFAVPFFVPPSPTPTTTVTATNTPTPTPTATQAPETPTPTPTQTLTPTSTVGVSTTPTPTPTVTFTPTSTVTPTVTITPSVTSTTAATPTPTTTPTPTSTPIPNSVGYTATAYNVYKVNLLTNSTESVVSGIGLGENPLYLALDRPRGYLYAVLNTLTGGIWRMSTTTNTSVGPQLGGIFFTPYTNLTIKPDNTKAYFARTLNSNPGKIGIIDLDTFTIDGYINLPYTASDTPWHTAITPDGSRLYVSSNGGAAGAYGLYAIDTATNTVTASINIGPITGRGLCASHDGTKIYVVVDGQGAYVVDTQTNVATAIVPTLGTQLYSIAINGDDSMLYITDIWQGKLYTVRTSDYTLINTLVIGLSALGSRPGQITLNSDYSKAYIGVSFGVNGSGIGTTTVVNLTDYSTGSIYYSGNSNPGETVVF